MVFERLKIEYFKRRLLLEEKKKTARDKVRKKKQSLENDKDKLLKIEAELKKRISKEQLRTMTPSERKRLVARKKQIEKEKAKLKQSFKDLKKEALNIIKTFTRGVAKTIDEHERARKKISKRKTSKRRKKGKKK